jgi:glycosyltransferase involved in cell wall biosynthesis
MRIMLICYVFPPEPCTTGVIVRELAEDLTRAGHDVTVVTGWPNFPQGILYKGWRVKFRHVERVPEGYRVIRCGHAVRQRKRILHRLWYYFTFAVSSFINALAAGRVDAVLDNSTPMFGCWTAWLIARLKGARVVYWIHDVYPDTVIDSGMMREGLVASLVRWQDTMLCRRCDLTATISEGMRQTILKRGLDPKRVVVASNWLDQAKFPLAPRDNPWRASQGGLGPEKFVVLHAGTIGFVSAPMVMIDAAERLRERDDIILLIVGEGPVKDDLVKEAHRRQLRNVRFLPFQPAEVLHEVQAASDVSLVTLSRNSGANSIPSRMIGYIAAARPVIAAVRQDSATATMIREGNFGFIVEPEDPDALAGAIRSAADNRRQLDRLGKNARKFFIKTYDRKTCTKVCESILTDPLPL